MISYLKSMLYTSGIILITTIILTVLNYFNILSGLPLKITMLIIPIAGVFIGSFLIGKSSNQKGYIEGLKYGIVWIILLTIISLLTKSFHITSIIYYVITLLLSVLASILGINRKKI